MYELVNKQFKVPFTTRKVLVAGSMIVRGIMVVPSGHSRVISLRFFFLWSSIFFSQFATSNTISAIFDAQWLSIVFLLFKYLEDEYCFNSWMADTLGE